MKVYRLVEDGFTCGKQCADLGDVLCLANHTLSISFQFAALPSMKRLPEPIEVSRVRAESLDGRPFYVKYVMDRENLHEFQVRQDQMIGIVELRAPLRGPRTELVRLHMNVYSRSHVLVGHNVALIEVDISRWFF